MIDTTINLPTVLTLGVAVIGFIAWLIRMEGRVSEAVKDCANLSRTLSVLEGLVMLHKEQFHEYQLLAAKEFMTQAAFGEIKRELISEIGRMESRLEAQIERLSPRSNPVPRNRRTAGQS